MADLKLVKYNPDKHLPKDPSEQINDLYFLLYILGKANEASTPVTTLSLTKTLFKIKLDFAKKGLDFLATDFYPYIYGPFNTELYRYIETLEDGGFVSQSNNMISLKTKSLELYDILKIYLENNYPKENKELGELTEKYTRQFTSFKKAINDTHTLKVEKENGDIVTVDDLAEDVKKKNLFVHGYYFEPNYKITGQIRISDELVNLFLDREDPVRDLKFNSLEELVQNARLAK